MISLSDIPNSFVTFDNSVTYLTQRECAILRAFCLPMANANDVTFQFIMNNDENTLSEINTRLRLRTKDIEGNFSFVNTFTKNVSELAENTFLITIGISPLANIFAPYEIGDCFQLGIGLSFDGELYYNATAVQCFQRVSGTCYTSLLQYRNFENAFGFYYQNNYANQIRLPIYFRNPQVKADQDTYVKSDGTRKKLFAVLSKQFQGLVDNTTEEVHQKLIVALSHDYVSFKTDNGYFLECTFENEYNNNFPEVLMGVNVWSADFLVMETPFDEQNNNCV